ncbi:MAG: hypoxanthine phosphoribosyltransferase [Bacteroidaceae bacterium]|nr:hypoxanthine phosphoribosyltransferase [Bacteroidaceae bacterium]
MITVNDLHFEKFISEDEIKSCVAQVAAKINQDYSGKIPVLIGILNGAFVFAADLVRELAIEHEIHFAKFSSYDGTETTGNVKELIGINMDLKGRDVIIVEDIIDTGTTMYDLLPKIKQTGAKSVEICTMLLKPGKLQVPLRIKYCAKEIPNAFILGYGLDYNNLGRNYKDIYVLKD